MSCLAALCAAQAGWRLEFVSDVNYKVAGPLPDGVLARKASGAFGGISALAYDAKAGVLYALSDSAKPVLFSFAAKVEAGKLKIEPLKSTPLTEADGGEIATWTLDPEGMALTGEGTLLIASEGYAGRTPAVDPSIVEFGVDGRKRRAFEVPAKFKVGEGRGVRHNYGFESLTLGAGGRKMFVASEGPLVQDGAGCGLGAGCVARIVEYSKSGLDYRPGREFVYPVEAMTLPAGMKAGRGNTGVSEMLWVREDELLVMERSFVMDPETKAGSNRIRMHLAELKGATDVSGVESLQGAEYTAVKKTLVLDFDSIVGKLEKGFQSLDNMEAICFGPRMADGAVTVIVASDDNYSDTQRTVLMLFRLERDAEGVE